MSNGINGKSSMSETPAANMAKRLPRAAPRVPASGLAAHGDERGEVFPVAILFGGVLLTILLGLHMVLISVGRTAVRAAADRGVSAAQAAPVGELDCGEFTRGGRTVAPKTAQACGGVIATLQALNSSGAMVGQSGPPIISVDDDAGVVSVAAYGSVLSPVFGRIEIIGYACGPLERTTSRSPTPADPEAC